MRRIVKCLGVSDDIFALRSVSCCCILLTTWWWPACCGLCSLWGVSTTTSETWRASGAKWCCRWVQLIAASAASHLDPCVMCGSKQVTWFFRPSQPVQLYQGNHVWGKHTQKPANNFFFLHFHLKKRQQKWKKIDDDLCWALHSHTRFSDPDPFSGSQGSLKIMTVIFVFSFYMRSKHING